MIAPARRDTAVELTRDPRIQRRVARLAAVSAVALGLITFLAAATLAAPPAIVGMLAAGWLLMPITLLASLGRPRLRYALVGPASLVGLALLAVCIAYPARDPLVAAGWALMTAGVLLGGLLGLWLWYRLVPVPAALDDPESPGRWTLIAVHVGLVTVGTALAATTLLH